MKKYVSPEAIKVNFEANDIITASGMLLSSSWDSDKGWAQAQSVTWTDLIGF